MPDADLLAALKQAKLKKMFFAFVPKGGADGKLIVSKRKISPKEIAEAKKEISGGMPVTGKCFVEEGTLVFLVARDVAPTLAATVKKVAKHETGLAIDPEFRIATDADAEESDDHGAEPAVAPATTGQANLLGLQKALQKLGFDPGPLDGATVPQAALMQFQQASGLLASGVLDHKTQAALAKALHGMTSSAASTQASATSAPPQTVSTPPSGSQDDASLSPPTAQEMAALEDRRRDFKRARMAWVTVKAQAEEDLEKVKDGARMEYLADADQFPKIVNGCKEIDTILHNLDDQLRDTLDRYASTPLKNQTKLHSLAATATEILDRYISYVEGNPIMKAIDGKEFADVAIHAPIKKALADLRNALL